MLNLAPVATFEMVLAAHWLDAQQQFELGIKTDRPRCQ